MWLACQSPSSDSQAAAQVPAVLVSQTMNARWKPWFAAAEPP